MNPPSKALLLFIHGFMGGEDSFVDFPLHVLQSLKSQLQLQNIEGRILPKFESKGDVHRVTNQLVNWLMLNASQREYSHVILLCHSMGGILAANAIIKMKSMTGVPLIGLLAYDSPFYGIESHTITKDVVSKAVSSVGEFTNPIVESVWSVSSNAAHSVMSLSSSVASTSYKVVFGSSLSKNDVKNQDSSTLNPQELDSVSLDVLESEKGIEMDNQERSEELKEEFQEIKSDIVQESQNVDSSSSSLLTIPPQDPWKPWITAGVTATAFAVGIYYTGGLVSGSVARKVALGVASSVNYCSLHLISYHIFSMDIRTWMKHVNIYTFYILFGERKCLKFIQKCLKFNLLSILNVFTLI